MLNVLEAQTNASITIDQFLEYGTKLISWIGSNMITFLNTLMEHPVTAVFLIVALVYVVIGVVSRFTR